MPTSDAWFLAKVYRVSALVWVIGFVAALGLWSWRAALGWTIGSLISGGVVRGVEIVVRASFTPGQLDARRKLASFTLAKLIVLGVALSAVILAAGTNAQVIIGMCVGLLLVQSVMLVMGLRELLRGNTLE